MIAWSYFDLIPTIVLMATASFGTLISTATAALFWVAYRYEKKLQTMWRSIGFLFLGAALSLAILSFIIPEIQMASGIVEALAFFLIWRGVAAEPKLTHLRTIATLEEREKLQRNARVNRFGIQAIILVIGAAAMIGFADKIPYLPYLVSAACIACTIILQIRRYHSEIGSDEIRQQNFYPLLAYVLLFLSEAIHAAAIFTRITPMWYLSLGLANLGFLFLANWAWIFIRVRPQLKISFQVLSVIAIGLALVVFATTFLFIYTLAILFKFT